MFRFVINALRFRLGQRAGRKFARSIGLRWLSGPIGFFSGLKALR
ncbi:MAG: hypothetical protein R3338_02230 [Thermoanaerobaculia bacterium]|nr:hypothetical protein [Thermoanaerobaculia bacterium]